MTKLITIIGVISGVLGIIAWLSGVSSLEQAAEYVISKELPITPKIDGENIDVSKLKLQLDNPSDKKHCKVIYSTALNKVSLRRQQYENAFTVVCKKYPKGRNIEYTIYTEDRVCYGNGNGLLGEHSSAIINCTNTKGKK